MSSTEAETTNSAHLIATALQHHQSGRFPEARAIYMQVLADDPDNFDALHLLGVLAHQVGKHDIAVDLIEKAVRQNDGNAVAYNNLGEAYKGLRRLQDAERSYRRALEIKPDFAEVRSNLGNALKDLGRLDEAEQVFREAVELNPSFFVVHANLGNLLRERGQLDEAEALYRQALELKPDYAEAALNLSHLELMQGRYEEGLELLEKRLEVARDAGSLRTLGYMKQLRERPRWDGRALAGQKLLLVAEHGAGDNIMMMRYLPLLKKQEPASLGVYATPHLVRLFEAQEDIGAVIPMTAAAPEGYDLWCPIMSLPYLLRTRLESIPDRVPYLQVPQHVGELWKSRLSEMSGAKVGLCWAAGRLSNSYRQRSVELDNFADLVAVKNVQLVSLQKGKESAQLQGLGWEIGDLMEDCKDFLDTAALIEQLDLVISVDTSVAHLAGALGKPVWLLNCYESEWRWMRDREDSPWYPTMQVFRQKKPGEWGPVLQQIAEELVLFAETLG